MMKKSIAFALVMLLIICGVSYGVMFLPFKRKLRKATQKHKLNWVSCTMRGAKSKRISTRPLNGYRKPQRKTILQRKAI